MEDKKNNAGCAAGCLGGCLLSSLLIVLILIIVCFMPILGFFSIFGGSSNNSNSTNSNNVIVESTELLFGFVSPFSGGFKFTAPDYPYDGENHTGEDIGPLNKDKSILAMYDAKVIDVRTGCAPRKKCPVDAPNPKLQDWGGNQVVLEFEHEDWPDQKMFLNFCHMKSIDVSVNQYVKKGQVIGVMGDSGNADGQHLHLILAIGPTWSEATSLPPRIILGAANAVGPKARLSKPEIILVSTRKGELYE